jgi:hypothetical protein
VQDAVLAYLPTDTNKRRDFLNAIDAFVYADAATAASNIDVKANATAIFASGLLTGTGSIIPLPNNYINLVTSIAIKNSGGYVVPPVLHNIHNSSTTPPTVVDDLMYPYTIASQATGETFVQFNAVEISQGTTITSGGPFGGPVDDVWDGTTGARKLFLNLGISSSGSTMYATFPDFVKDGVVSTRIKVSTISSSGTVPDNAVWKYGDMGSGPSYKQFIYSTGTNYLNRKSIQITPLTTDTITVSYYYNTNLQIIADYLSNPANYFLGQDIALYPATPVPVYMEVLVQIAQTYGTTDRVSAVQQKLQDVIAAYLLGTEVNQATLIADILTVEGVVDVSVPFIRLARGSTATLTLDQLAALGTKDIVLSPKEYPVILNANDIKVSAVYTAVGS